MLPTTAPQNILNVYFSSQVLFIANTEKACSNLVVSAQQLRTVVHRRGPEMSATRRTVGKVRRVAALAIVLAVGSAVGVAAVANADAGNADWLTTPIPASPALAANNAAWVGYLSDPRAQRVANLYNYGVTLIPASAISSHTPRYDLSFTKDWGADPFGPNTVPIPPGTRRSFRRPSTSRWTWRSWRSACWTTPRPGSIMPRRCGSPRPTTSAHSVWVPCSLSRCVRRATARSSH